MITTNSIDDSAIAIIGISGRFPQAKEIDTFWKNLQEGVESIDFFSEQELLQEGIDPTLLKKQNYVKAGSVISDIDLFDANFFGYNPREAEIIDPQQRLFLESAVEALEVAGYDSQTYSGAIGVYAGLSENSYARNNIYPHLQNSEPGNTYQLFLGNGHDFLSTRVSYKLNLTGPSITVQTACSTSLVAVHLACQSLLTGECDMALAGGVSIQVPHKTGYLYQEGMILSPDGHCRTFDAEAKGTLGGNGLGIVVLKRLEDAIADGDYIYAQIKGSAINNDGSSKVGYTAPSVEGQAAAISEAQSIAGIDPETITYIEAHGTATPLGDPIEIAALTKVFRGTTEKKGFCAIGSLKTNMGHLDAAAGVAGLIKTVLALKHNKIPPSLNFETPNPTIDFANSPFYVNRTLSEWNTNGIPRRAGVSSFGLGGTNAHVVIEEVPTLEPSSKSRPWQLLMLSAKTNSALEIATTNLATHLKQHPEIDLADVAYTLQIGRTAFEHRRMLVCQEIDDALKALSTPERPPVLTYHQEPSERPVVFMFSGQGSQYVNMAVGLYQTEPTFSAQVDSCSELLIPHLGVDLRHILYPQPEQTETVSSQLKQTAIAQSALFVVSYALAILWQEWGVSPQAMIGQSIGEYVAATLAGVFSLEDALALVAKRGQLMQKQPPGTMLAVSLSEQQCQKFLDHQLSLAAINGLSQCVISGPTEAIDTLQQHLSEQKVESRRLHTSHAFHSQMMESVLEPFIEHVKQIPLHPPQIPYISNVTGTWITAEQATDPNYWGKHLRQTVRFADGLQELMQKSNNIFLEVGPGRTLITLAKRYAGTTEQVILSSVRHPQDSDSDVAFLLRTLGKLWLNGVEIDWSGFSTHEQRHRLPLPTYPFERQRYWIDPPKLTPVVGQFQATSIENVGYISQSPSTVKLSQQKHSRPKSEKPYIAPRNEIEQTLAQLWQELVGFKEISINDDFFVDLAGDSLVAVQFVSRLNEAFQIDLDSHILLHHPTIADVAELVQNSNLNTTSQDSSLKQLLPDSIIEIQTGSNLKLPLFLIHPVGGHVYFYKDLAYYLGKEQPVYGLEDSKLHSEKVEVQLVEEMAAKYIEAMLKVQSEGPYLIGGSSFGGLIAFEIANQLQKLNRKVELLALIDTPTSEQMPVKLEKDEDIIEYLAQSLLDDDSLVSDLPKHLDTHSQLSWLCEQFSNTSFFQSDLSQLQRLIEVFKANMNSMWNYTPQPYPGRVVFFYAKERRELYDPLYPFLPWIDLATGGIEIQTVPGDHISMHLSPNIEVLAEKLGGYLQDIAV
ncbi:MAG: acyltransferase domain-containing protein [Moorea sp. SIO3C2]|nr:acyltransferase domain-containing protein [Moorena sp. SIO3C2]